MKKPEKLMLQKYFKKIEKKLKKRKRTKDVSEKIEEYSRSKKIKTMIDFDQNECNSMKSIAIKKNLEVDVTTRFIFKCY